jgi:AcrR family transcriptional regulator
MARKMTPKPYHHGDLYETLVNAGTELLKDKGPEQFTLRECARRAGVSHAAPKNHFASVEDLLCEIAARGFDRFVIDLDAMADAAASQAADDRLIAMGQAYVAFARANPAIYLLMFRHSQAFNKSAHLQTAANAAWDQLETAVRAVIGPDRDDVVNRASHVWALVHGIASLIIDRRLPVSADPAVVIAQSLSSLPAAIRGLGQA